MPRFLDLVFVTGEAHPVYHAGDPHLGGSNFGFLFTFWDRLFGTWVDPKSLPAGFQLGLADSLRSARTERRLQLLLDDHLDYLAYTLPHRLLDRLRTELDLLFFPVAFLIPVFTASSSGTGFQQASVD